MVLTEIPSYLSFTRERNYALVVPPRDPGAVAEAVDRALSDPELWERLRTAGLEVTAQYPIEAAVEQLECVLLAKYHPGRQGGHDQIESSPAHWLHRSAGG